LNFERKLSMRVQRLEGNPIIRPHMDGSMGENISGHSLIRVPDWVEDPLGRYYLYFAEHKGKYIRMAYSDRLEGPWRTYEPGVLNLEDSFFPVTPPEKPTARVHRLKDAVKPHIASPDAHVLEEHKEIRLYYHGLEAYARQVSRLAVSKDGIHFKAMPEAFGLSYFRMFRHEGRYYGMAMPGVFYRSHDGLKDFERGPHLFGMDMRHSALLVCENNLHVFWTRVGDAPERILLSTIDMTQDWEQWVTSEPVNVLRPEYPWEGSDQPVVPSVRGWIDGPVNQLRDPTIYQEADRLFLLYTVAGESGIAIAELFL